MIDKLIKQAKEIEATTDANTSGALVQVTNNLTIDKCEEIFKERCGDNMTRVARYAKKIARAKEGSNPFFNVGQLRNDVLAILEAVLRDR